MDNDKPLDRIYLSIVGSLKRAAAGIVPPKEVADIVQEAYVRACQTERESPITSPRSFLFKTVKNLALDHVKRAETRLRIVILKRIYSEFQKYPSWAFLAFESLKV